MISLPNAFDPDLNWLARIARAYKVAMQGVDVFAGHSALGCGHCLSSNLSAEGTLNPRLHSRASKHIGQIRFLDGQNLANGCHLHAPYALRHFSQRLLSTLLTGRADSLFFQFVPHFWAQK